MAYSAAICSMWSLSSLYCSGREDNAILWKKWWPGQAGPTLLAEAMTSQDRSRDGERRLLEATEPSPPARRGARRGCAPGNGLLDTMGTMIQSAVPSGLPRSLWEARCGQTNCHGSHVMGEEWFLALCWCGGLVITSEIT